MRLRKAVAPAASVFSAVLVACFAGCASDLRILGYDSGDAASPDKSFNAPEQDGSTGDGSSTTIAMCAATECPSPFATCPGAAGSLPFKCETNLLSDPLNCGACGNACESNFGELHMRATCVGGACGAVCETGTKDCNGLVDDGCEANVGSDSDNCGTCGNQCPELAPGLRLCLDFACRTCPSPLTWCATGCTDTNVDKYNCGACGNECPPMPADTKPPPPQMTYSCSKGECGKLVCLENWADCNGELSDGCEINIRFDPQNCATCGNACAPGQACIIRIEHSYTVPVCACEQHETMCAGNHCVDLLADINNCGACGNKCPTINNSESVCRNGFCEAECISGWGDCDGDPGQCETNLLFDARNCGTCGNRCDTAAGQPCVNGSCLMTSCDGPVTK